MEGTLTQITNYLLTQSWQIALLVAVVAMVNLVLRNRSAHVRYLLWLIVLAKCLVPPLLTVPLAVLPQDKPVLAPILERTVASEVEPVSLPSTPVHPSPPGGTVAPRPVRLNPRQWLGLAWSIGVAAFVLIAVSKALRTQLWLKRKRKPLPADLHIGIADLFSGLGLKKFPKVWLVEGIGQPFVWGVLRGGIYLPANFVKVNSIEHRRGVLGHELSHVLRFDAAVNLFQVIAQAVFWFHPFVWWANRKLRAEREKCCDEMAIARLDAQVRDYSKAIVDTLVTEYESTRPVPSLAIAGPVKNIEERIKTMLRPGKKFYKRPSLPAVAVVVLTALLAVPTTIVLTARADAAPIFGNPTNLGPTVNSSVEDSGPCISADGLSLYFQSRRPGGLGETDVWVTTRKTENEPWAPPVNLGPPVNTTASDQNPRLSADGLELYFTSDRPGGSGDLDIWVTQRKAKNDPWSSPVNLGPKVNSAMAEIDPTISTDGLSLYFSDAIWRDPRPIGLGGPDIWVTTRKSKDAPWDPAVNLGPAVNTSGMDVAPSISTDGLTLYFASNRNRGTYDQPDIWMTTRKTKDDPWGLPVNLGPTVNNPLAGEWGPDISSDGSTLYFVSINSVLGQGFGKADIWQVSLNSPRAKE